MKKLSKTASKTDIKLSKNFQISVMNEIVAHKKNASNYRTDRKNKS